MLRLAFAVLLAAPACAQPGPAPPSRRADSVVTRPTAPGPDAPARADSSVSVRSETLLVGETPVEVRVSERPCAAACWSALNVHDDENTAVEAALGVIGRRGGRLVELRHSGARNLTFQVGGEAFAADPNRIFTDVGRARTLATLSRDTPAARAALAAFAGDLLALYGTPSVVVALHNNTEANYSALGYAPGGTDAREAASVFLAPGADPDDFVFVTTQVLFEAVRASGVTAILQDNAAATDDGSLSVWAAQNGRPYVNIEAQHGNDAANRAMVEALPAWLAAE